MKDRRASINMLESLEQIPESNSTDVVRSVAQSNEELVDNFSLPGPNIKQLDKNANETLIVTTI